MARRLNRVSREYSKLDVILVNRSENYLIFEDDEYLFNDETGVSSLNPDYTIQQVRELPVPCRVNLRYIKIFRDDRTGTFSNWEPKFLNIFILLMKAGPGLGAISGRN